MSGFRVPVLTYHAGIITSPDYLGNDHVALAADLEMFDRMGWRVVPASTLIDALIRPGGEDLRRCVVLTCDDGTDLDVRDIDVPGFGVQPSFLSIVQAARARAATPGSVPHLTSFVIADPVARRTMDRRCLHGLDWIGEDWWAAAQRSGAMEIGCHSWDHNHPVLEDTGPDGMPRGDFLVVDREIRARFEVDQAIAYLNQRIAPATCRYFCYPFGQASDYLRGEYLPRFGPALGIEAAFGVQGEPASADSDRWQVPRYVCGWHWKSPEELARLLMACG